MTTPRPTHTPRDVLRGLGALLTLIGFLAGVPIALIALAPVYLPTQVPTGRQLWNQAISPDDGSLLALVLAAVAWLAWAAFSTSVLVDLACAARRVHTPRLPLLSGFQRTTSHLLATAALLIATAGPITALATPATATTLTSPAVPAPQAPPHDTPIPTAAAGDVAAVPEATSATAGDASRLPSITVQRGDTLWDLAERHLGDPLRYTQIRDLNVGRSQPDGRALINADWILPGWTLLLPTDATDARPPAPAAHPTSTPSVDSVVVQPGDTLWDIAASHLGDGSRYPQIVALNLDTPQPDGGRLTDPDLIRPGWVLPLPTRQVTAPSAAQQPTVPTTIDSTPTTSSSPGEAGASLPSEQTTAAEPEPAPGTSSAAVPSQAPSAPPDTTRHLGRDMATQTVSPWFVGLTALGAVGVVGEIARRRHLQQRARKVGEAIPLPAPTSPEAAAERALRTAATPVSIDALRTTLRNLAAHCFTTGRPLPRVGGLLLGEHHLTLLLLDDDPEPVAPFAATAPNRWLAPTADVASPEQIDDPEPMDPYPLLVSLGHTADATLVVNLEAAGTLAVVGDDSTADDVLRALVLETATSDLAGQLAVHVDPQFADLAGAFEDFRLRATDGRDDRTGWATAVAASLNGQGLDNLLAARSRRLLPDLWLPQIYVETELGGPPSTPWSSVVTLTRRPVDTGWTLQVDQTGAGQLDPLGVVFQPQRMSHGQVERLRTVLETSLPPEPQRINGRLDTGTDGDLTAARVAYPRTETTAPAAPQVTVNILGPVQVLGLTGRAPTAQMVELLTYLALHGPTSGADLDDVIWNGARDNANTRNVFIHRLRERVGTAVLPMLGDDGLFRLGGEIGTDWQQFQTSVAAAIALDGNDRVDRLTTAVDLVRGRPFRGIKGAEYAWADYDIQLMTGAIVDACHLLARLHYDAGRHRDAVTVASRGLAVEPFADTLQEIAILATEAHAGHQAARQLRDRYARLMARLDPELA
jgi:nucleoid-associated protein YgaU